MRVRNAASRLLPGKYALALVFVGVLHVALFAFVLPGPLYGDQDLGGDQHYFRYASRLVRGELPYRDFFVEYPIFALVPFTLPRLLSAAPFVWERLYTIQILLWDLLGICFVAWAGRRLGPWAGRRLGPWAGRRFDRSLVTSLGVYTLGLLAIGPLITQRFDLVPAALTLIALAAYLDGRYKVAWGALILSVLTKAYAVVVGPLFILDLARRRQFREAVFGIALLTLATVITLVFVVFLSSQAMSDVLTFHQLRGAEIESLYANAGLLAHLLSSTPLEVSYEFMSVNASSPLVDNLIRHSLPLTAAGLLGVYLLHWRRPLHRRTLVSTATGAILVFIVCNKVLSPQYLIWLLPLIPLTGSLLAAGMFILAAALTTVLYPLNFGDLASMAPWAVATLTLRNLLLLGLLIPVLKRGHVDREEESPASWQSGLIRRLEWAVLGGFVLALPLVFVCPAPPNAEVHLPPDLDGDGALSERELYVTQRGGVDYDFDGHISQDERRVLRTSGLDANGDGFVDGDELRFFLCQGPPD